jgi:putative endopeptidase
MAKTISKKRKGKNKTVKKYHHDHNHRSTLEIIHKSKEEFNKLLKYDDSPMLKRLFRSSNIKKLNKLPENLLNMSKYSTTLKKEFERLKKDKKFQPNQDFYDYVNYEWIQKQTEKLKDQPKYYVEVDDFRIVQDKVYKEVIGYVDDFIKHNSTTKKGKSIKAVRNCIEKANKKKGLDHCQNILEDITNHIKDENMYGLLAYANEFEIISWQAPIVWTVLPDEKDVTKYISHISPPQLGLYDYFIYIDDPTDDPKTKKFKKEFREKYFEFIENTFKKVLPHNHKEFKAQDVWDTELQLLDAMGCREVKKEDPDYYNVVTKKELEDDYDFNWTLFYNTLGSKPPKRHNHFLQEIKKNMNSSKKVPNKVIVSSLNSLKCTMEVLKKNWATKQWKTYWLFIFYKQMIRLDYDWAKVYFDFYGKFVTGQPVQWPRDLYSIFPLSFCYNTFLTEQYVEHNDNPQLEVYVKNMVNDLKYIFIKKIERNTWLSPSTKKSALLKLKKLEVQIGTPKKIRADPILDYKEDDPWHNMRILGEWRFKKGLELEGKPIRDIPTIDWNTFKLVGTQAYMVNAYYRPTSNSIYVPLAYLQKPFIDMDQRGIEYNLAYIGYTLGHELSHSLDDMGSKFDADGNMNNWWTDHDKKIFQNKIKDVVKQYEEAAKKDGIKFDASIGVGEDLADISGISLAEEYLYYFQLIHNTHPLLKNVSLEAFYVYSAIQSRQKIFDAALPSQLKQNPHPLEKYRCNCPLARLKLFRELYQVKKGDGMWWHNTDTIW